MLRVRFLLVICLAGAISTSAPAQSRPAKAGFTDEDVEKAISKAVAYLWSAQDQETGTWIPCPKGETGLTALVAYALIESGESPQSQRMAKALKWLGEHDEARTYSVACRANAYLAAERQAPGKYRRLLARDVRVLVRNTSRGAYSYVLGQDAGSPSNDHFGALGVWAGAQANVEIPRKYWSALIRHWRGMQRADGGWGYSRDPSAARPSTGAMTAAGIVTLIISQDHLDAAKFVNCTGNVIDLSVQRGLDWLEKNFQASLDGRIRAKCLSYTLFAIERAALASGYKYFGKIDWYKIGTKIALQSQDAAGAFRTRSKYNNRIVDTSFCLLFLIRGRNAVLFNKLQYDGDWNNRPRALASLTRWISRTFETTVNWQIINLKAPAVEWHDAPILFISGAKAPTFSKEELQKLRDFVWQGGTIFSCTECHGRGFKDGIRKVYAELFPQYEMVQLAKGHEIYSIHFKLGGWPKLQVITNGVRPLVIHTDEDLPRYWQLQQTATGRRAYQAAANVFMYTTDKGSLRHRGARRWPQEAQFSPKRTVKIARLRYAGNYDPEPLAYERFTRLMGARTQTKVQVTEPIGITDLAGAKANLAVLTGTASFTLQEAEKSALKKFVAEGGTLLIDAAGGSDKFAESAEKLLTELYGPDAVTRLSSLSPLYRMKGMEIEKVKYRRGTRSRIRSRKPNLRAVVLENRAAVIFSKEDLTAALVGYPSYTCHGYDPQSAFKIVRNIVLYAAEGAKK